MSSWILLKNNLTLSKAISQKLVKSKKMLIKKSKIYYKNKMNKINYKKFSKNIIKTILFSRVQ